MTPFSQPARIGIWSGGTSRKARPIPWAFTLHATVARVTKEIPFFVISSRIRVPRENGSRVKTQHPPSLRSVVIPLNCVPDAKSVALTVARNGYLAGLFPVGGSDFNDDSPARNCLNRCTYREPYCPKESNGPDGCPRLASLRSSSILSMSSDPFRIPLGVSSLDLRTRDIKA